MRRVPRPTVTADEALLLCIASVRDLDLKRRLRVVRPAINSAEADYLEHARHSRLYLIPTQTRIGRSVSQAEMDKLYNQTFVKSAGTKAIYGQLKKACVNDICPLCAQRTVHQLDHYLPISGHPLFAVTSANLVPACPECNKIKLAYAATTAGEQTLHPYFDDVEGERWLFADVVQSSPAALVFSARPPAGMVRTKRQRIVTHFETFELGTLYTSHAGAEINDIRHHLLKIDGRNGARRISAFLREQAESRAAAHVNSWQRVTYETLADSTWFCSGGFRGT